MKIALRKVVLFYVIVLVIISIAIAYFVPAEIEEPSEEFMSLCDDLFTNKNQATIANSYSVDITHEFLQEYQMIYLSGDYGTLWDVVLENGYTITWISG